MKLQSVEGAQVGLVADWLASPPAQRWLDFGPGVRTLSAAAVRVMTQRDIHMLRLFTTDESDEPIGLVALSDIDRTFGTGRLWYVLGEREYAARGYTSRAVAQLLDHAFATLGLQAVNAWVVECNAPSIRVLERNGFTLTGRLRRSHLIDGRAYDRLLFDLLAEEFRADGNGR